MRSSILALAAALAFAGCGTEGPPCSPPDGCLAASEVSGTCECHDWKVISDHVVPLKFLVVGVFGPPPGSRSVVTYGSFSASSGYPPGQSQLGTRMRAVVRDAQGKETVLSVSVPSPGVGQYTMTALGGRTLAVSMVAADGIGLGGGDGFDLYPPSRDQVMVWVNPTLRMVTDAGGHVHGVWGWSGTCFWPPGAIAGTGQCSAPQVLLLDRGEVDGTIPMARSYWASFLATLEPDDRSLILGYDRLAAVPQPTAADLDSDPRFLRLGDAQLDPLGSQTPDTSWTPCPGVARDDDFPVFATTEVPLDASTTVLVEQSWLSATLDCATQKPGLMVGTTTQGCRLTSRTYLDRMFGTLAFLPETVPPACTTPPP